MGISTRHGRNIGIRMPVMTNEQWSDVTRYLKLPDTARKPLEEQLESYRSRDILPSFANFAGAGAEPDPRPSDVKKKLERAASLAGELLDILEGVKTLGFDALIDPAVSEASFEIAKGREALWGNSSTMLLQTQLEYPEGQSPAISALIAVIHHHAHLPALYARLSIAAETFAIKGKSGRDPSDVRELLTRVSKIVEN